MKEINKWFVLADWMVIINGMIMNCMGVDIFRCLGEIHQSLLLVDIMIGLWGGWLLVRSCIFVIQGVVDVVMYWQGKNIQMTPLFARSGIFAVTLDPICKRKLFRVTNL